MVWNGDLPLMWGATQYRAEVGPTYPPTTGGTAYGAGMKALHVPVPQRSSSYWKDRLSRRGLSSVMRSPLIGKY